MMTDRHDDQCISLAWQWHSCVMWYLDIQSYALAKHWPMLPNDDIQLLLALFLLTKLSYRVCICYLSANSPLLSRKWLVHLYAENATKDLSLVTILLAKAILLSGCTNLHTMSEKPCKEVEGCKYVFSFLTAKELLVYDASVKSFLQSWGSELYLLYISLCLFLKHQVIQVILYPSRWNVAMQSDHCETDSHFDDVNNHAYSVT